MDYRGIFSKKRIIFLVLFVALVLIGKKINFSPLVGAESQFLTLYQFFGPIAGAFLGPFFGVIAVFGAQISDSLIVGKEWTWINLVRLTPMLFAAWYFGTKKRWMGVAVPLAAIVLFVVHPVGRYAWLYAMFWLIPIVIKLLPGQYSSAVFARSLGATFTAHCVGAVAWLYTFPMTAEQWLALIPVTAVERWLFAGGIAVSYVLMNTVLDVVVSRWKLKIPADVLRVDKRYVLARVLGLAKAK
ncbi:hypothetical protein ACFL3V_02350 [Nanoarchaeota archaeon]